ncbi:hypothetical protein NBRC116494_20460 [Aurantivibrio plasticivorans]
MKSYAISLCLTCFISLGFISPGLKAENITLDDEDLLRLDIAYARLQTVDASHGIELPGTTVHAPNTTAQVFIRHAGIVSEWRIQPGQKVNKGEIIGSVLSEDIVSLQNQWMVLNAELVKQETALERDRSLFDAGVIAKQRLLNTENSYNQIRFDKLSTEQLLNQSGINTNDLQLLETDAEALGIFYVRAPATGVLVRRAAEIGEYVEANTPIATVQQSSKLWLRARLPATIGSQVYIGQQLTDGRSGAGLTVKQRDYEVDTATQTIQIFAEYNAPNNLMPGQVIPLIIPPAQAGVLIPADSVVYLGNQATVFIKTNNGVRAQDVNLIPAGNHYLATDDIEANTEVIVKGAAVVKGIVLGLGGGE